jgi:hypothetical protein
MIRSLLDRLGVGVLAAVGVTLLAISVAGVAGLAGRIDAASTPAPGVRPVDVTRDCPWERWRDARPRPDRPPTVDAPSTEL